MDGVKVALGSGLMTMGGCTAVLEGYEGVGNPS